MAQKETVQVNVRINGDEARKKLNDLQNESVLLGDKLKGLKKGTQEYIDTNKRLKEVQEELKKTKQDIGLAGLPLKDLQSESRKLRRELSLLAPETQEFVDKAKELKAVDDRIKEVREGINGTTQATSLLQTGFRSAVAALGPLLAAGVLFEQIVQLTQYLFGLDKAWTKLEGTIQKASNLQGEALSKAAGQVQALTNTFGLETNEINKAANSLAKNMGVSYTEALRLIEQGMLAGANMSGDFLDQLYEYAPQFKQAGIEAETMVAELVRAEKEGIFSDKGADVIKEFGLRIREQTKATKDALTDAFGAKFTDELFKGLNNGSITTVEALKRVSTQMNNTTVPANKLQTVVADVFGGPGEDAGLRYLQSLKNIGGGIEALIDNTNSLTQSQQKQLAREKELAAVQQQLADELAGSSSLWESLTTNLQILGNQVLLAVIQSFNDVKNAIIDVYNNSLAFRALVQGIGLTFQTQVAVIKAYFGIVMDGYAMVGKSAAAVIKGDFAALPGILKESSKEMGQNLTDLGKELGENFTDAYNETINGRIDTQAPTTNTNPENAAALAELKKQEEEKKKAKAQADKEALKKQQEANFALRELQIQAMEEGTQKEIEKIKLDYDRKVAAIDRGEIHASERIKLLRQLQQQELALLDEEARKKEAEFARAYEDLKLQLMEEGEAKRIAKVELEYKRKIEAIDRNEALATERIKVLEDLRDQEIEKIREESAEKRLQKDLEALLVGEEEKELLLKDKLANALIAQEEYDEAVFDLQTKSLQAQLDLLKANGKEETDQYRQIQGELLQLHIDRNKQQVENEKLKKESIAEINREMLNAGIEVYDGITEGLSFAQDAQRQKLQEKADFAKEKYGEESEEYKRRQADITKFERTEGKRRGNLLKALAAGQILISLQQEIAKYFVTPGWPAAGLLAASAAIRAGIGIAKVNAQQFGKGGKLPGQNSILRGPSHAQGGMPIVNPKTGAVVAEVEGGEPLLSRSTYLNNRPIVDALLYSGRYRGGAPIRMETGGTVPTAFSSPSSAPLDPTNPTDSTQSAALSVQLMSEMLAELKRLNARLPFEIRGKWVYSDFEKLKNRLDADEASGQF